MPISENEGIFSGAFRNFVSSFAIPNMGVAIFYGLSSFLLTYLALQEIFRTGAFDYKKFLLRRILRIWPLYFIAIVFALFVSGFEWYKREFWFVMTFLSNWSLAIVDINNHVSFQPTPVRILWSISLEEQFYLLLSVFLLIKPKVYNYLIPFLILISLAARTWFVSLGGIPSPGVGGLYFASLSYLDIFILGGCSAFLYITRYDLISKLSSATAGAIVFIFLLLTMRLWSVNLWAPYGPYVTYIYTVLGLATSAFILFVASNNSGYIFKFLNSDFLVFFGKISFSFYVWHIYTLDIAHKFTHNLAIPIIFGLIFTTGIAYLSYRVIEQQFMKLRQKFSTLDRK